MQICASGRNNIVTAISRGVPYWFVLAHEDHGDARSDAAEGWGGRGGKRDVMPGSRVGETGLWRVNKFSDEKRKDVVGDKGTLLCLWFATLLWINEVWRHLQLLRCRYIRTLQGGGGAARGGPSSNPLLSTTKRKDICIDRKLEGKPFCHEQVAS